MVIFGHRRGGGGGFNPTKIPKLPLGKIQIPGEGGGGGPDPRSPPLVPHMQINAANVLQLTVGHNR